MVEPIHETAKDALAAFDMERRTSPAVDLHTFSAICVNERMEVDVWYDLKPSADRTGYVLGDRRTDHQEHLYVFFPETSIASS